MRRRAWGTGGVEDSTRRERPRTISVPRYLGLGASTVGGGVGVTGVCRMCTVLELFMLDLFVIRRRYSVRTLRSGSRDYTITVSILNWVPTTERSGPTTLKRDSVAKE